MIAFNIVFVLALIIVVVIGEPVDDRIESLPLYGIPPTQQWSGYLDGTDGCDTSINGEYCKIHYWFASANRNANDKYYKNKKGESSSLSSSSSSSLDILKDNTIPVILWSNGGPGSSSVLGFLQELGPLLMNATGGLMVNPYSWTNIPAHVLVMEFPVGVGYSYCQKQMEDGSVCINTDKYTASTNRAALVDFFTTKFPELSNNPFYIIGESYAGVYIPTLTREILDYPNVTDSVITNFVGIAVGDPCTDNDAQRDSMDSLWYSAKYGLISDDIYDKLYNQCNIRNIPKRSNNLLSKSHIVITGDGDNDNDNDEDDDLLAYPSSGKVSLDCKMAYYKFLLSSSKGLSQSWKNLFVNDYSLFGIVSNDEDNAMAKYMNRDDVREALHVTEAPIQNWPYPASGFNYKKEYDACNEDAHVDAISMIDLYYEITPKLKRVWVYNGDSDPCVSYEGTRTAIDRIGFNHLDGGDYRPWFYHKDAIPTSSNILEEKAAPFGPDLSTAYVGAQLGGYVINYENNLSFITFHGSGHMVPQFRPQSSYHFVYQFLNNRPLSPLMPTNQTLKEMTTKQFKILMDTWIEEAKSYGIRNKHTNDNDHNDHHHYHYNQDGDDDEDDTNNDVDNDDNLLRHRRGDNNDQQQVHQGDHDDTAATTRLS